MQETAKFLWKQRLCNNISKNHSNSYEFIVFSSLLIMFWFLLNKKNIRIIICSHFMIFISLISWKWHWFKRRRYWCNWKQYWNELGWNNWNKLGRNNWNKLGRNICERIYHNDSSRRYHNKWVGYLFFKYSIWQMNFLQIHLFTIRSVLFFKFKPQRQQLQQRQQRQQQQLQQLQRQPPTHSLRHSPI